VNRSKYLSTTIIEKCSPVIFTIPGKQSLPEQKKRLFKLDIAQVSISRFDYLTATTAAKLLSGQNIRRLARALNAMIPAPEISYLFAYKSAPTPQLPLVAWID